MVIELQETIPERQRKTPPGRRLAFLIFFMRVNQTLDEIRVYAGVAERTGAHVERSAVRRSGGCCGSVTDLIRKARASGDGTFYLPLDRWPAGTERVELLKPWVVISSARPSSPRRAIEPAIGIPLPAGREEREMDLPGSRCILIVDDDPGIRRLLVIFLKRRGFRLMEACDGREALAGMRAGNIDLVIMDLMMPGVSGYDVLRERAADPSLLRIPMIVVTASSSLGGSDGLLDEHVYAVIGKPFDLNKLLTTVTACLGHPRTPVLAAA